MIITGVPRAGRDDDDEAIMRWVLSEKHKTDFSAPAS
jgi:hypothetical protein